MVIKKIVLILYLVVLFFISCIPKKEMKRFVNVQNMSIPNIVSVDTPIFLCVQHSLVYNYKEWTDSTEQIKEVFSCYQTLLHLLEWEKSKYSCPTISGTNTIIIWDTTFLVNYILPLIRENKKKEIIEYTLSHVSDSSFKNIIDYDNKVIVNDKIYYYPMNMKTYVSIRSISYKWFISVVPQSSWIYKPDCFDDGKEMQTTILIPLLGKENKHRSNNIKSKEK
jgi:hypothetical protein